MAATKEQREIEIVMNGQKVNSSLKEMGAAAALMNNQLKKMAADDPGREKIKKDFHAMRDRIDGVRKELYGVEKASLAAKLGLNDMGGLMKTVLGTAGGFLVAGGVESVITSVIGYFGDASTAAKDFEVSLSNLSAITGATGEDLRFYEEQAMLIGETTSLSATQAVEAFKLIGSAKPELLQNKEALAAVTQEAIALAEASGMELPEAANSLASSLNQFGVGAEEAGRYINVLAAGAKEGSSEIQETAAALKNAGTVASGANLSFEQTNAAIQALAEISIKGGEAGTGLRNVLLTLQSGADDTNPAVVGLETALDNLGKKNMSTAELAKLFGKENVVVANQLVNSREKIADLTEAMTGTNTAYEQAATNMDNLEGDMKSLDSVTESYAITIGSGLNVAKREGVQLLTKFLLILKETPAFIRENKELFYALGVAIIALNLGNIKAVASTIAHTAAEKARSIATKTTTAYQWLLNAAMSANPVGALVAGVALLVGGFVILYKRSEAVRGGIAGLWSGFKELLSIAGDIASFLINPIQNAGKIKDIMNAGDRLGKAFSDGYNNKLKAEKEEREKEEDKDHAEAVKDAEDKGSDLGKATADGFAASLKGKNIKQLEAMLEVETDAAHKKLIQKQIQHLKEREKQEKEHQEKLLKAREQYSDAVAKTELENARLKIELMDKGVDKVLAKLRFQHEQEIKEIESQRQKVLENIAISEDEKQALLDNYADQKRMKDAELKAAEEAAAAEEKERKRNEELLKLDEEEELEMERLQNQFLRTAEAEANQEQARLELQRSYLQKRLDILEQAGLGETTQALKYKNAILKTDKEIADGKVENAERTAKAKKALEMMALDSAIEAFQVGIDLLDKESKARKVAVTALKAFSLGKVAIDYGEEVAAIWKTANQNPLNALIPGAGTAIAVVKTAAATKRTVDTTKNIMAQKFAKGGPTKGGKTIPMTEVGGIWQMLSGHSGGSIGAFADGGWVNNAQLGLIGEAGRELVLPNWMVESPKYANIVGWLEQERQKGIKAFASGGSTGDALPAPVETNDRLVEKFEELLQEFKGMKEEVSTWPSKLEVHNNVGDTRKQLQVLNDLEERAFG